MPKSLADRLHKARQARFVGRSVEQALFQSALDAAELPFQVLFISGPGGVGKTSLLNQFFDLCETQGFRIARVDGRDLSPPPDTFLRALRSALDLQDEDLLEKTLSNTAERLVILIDTYEQILGLDRWLREEFLPTLSTQVLVVLASQIPPNQTWQADPGWQTLLRHVALRNLSPAESRAYLERRGVPSQQHSRVLNFTHGHPLALSLVADVFDNRHDLVFEPDAEPNVIQMILERLAAKVPAPAYRSALEACALVKTTTEDLLAEMLDLPEAHELFEWLRGLSFIQMGRTGLFPHDLAREILAADLRWRNSAQHQRLHEQARAYYSRQIQRLKGSALQSVMVDLMFLHRNNPVVRPFFELLRSEGAGAGNLIADLANREDYPQLIEIVGAHEGQEAAEIAGRWLERGVSTVWVFRGDQNRLVGFMLTVALEKASPAEREADPAVRSAWNYLASHTPLRPGETASYFRFWMGSESHQNLSPVQTMIFVQMALHYLTTPNLAFSFFPITQPDFWAPLLAYADLDRILEIGFESGGLEFGVFGHDWRARPPTTWLDLMAERELALSPQSVQPRSAGESLVVLSQAEFGEAVLDALRNYTRPYRLQTNPLLRSRLVVEGSQAGSDSANRVETLRGRLRAGCQLLASSKRSEKYLRALELTYFNPAPTQEIAAERLDIPFRTFRRHLKSGIEELTEILWKWDVGLE